MAHCKVLFHLVSELNVLLSSENVTFCIILVFLIKEVSKKGLFVSLEVRNPTWPIWFREAFCNQQKSMQSFTFNFQVQPGLLIFATFKFLGK